MAKSLSQAFSDFWNGRNPENSFNDVFYRYIGGREAAYKHNRAEYLDKGYGQNPYVYAIISQQIQKTISVPYAVKVVKDKKNYLNLKSLNTATKGSFSPNQFARKKLLETKAYDQQEKDFPLEKPNPNNTWSELFSLYKLFMRTTGNAFFYVLAPEDGINKNVPKMVFILPSHKMKIVLKKNADLLYDENPIDYYALTEGDTNIKFEAEEVIHIKYANPFFDLQGSHLYGLSPMASLLKNLESSNEALKNNVKTLKNSGVFGIITGKNQVLNHEQAKSIKDKLLEMDRNPDRLSKLAGMNIPIEFTKLSLDTKDLMPFDYLNYDQKQICNVLGWSDSLLNNDDSGKYDRQKEEGKRVILNNILPDLILLQEAFTKEFIQKFKGYENAVLEFDISELPEMQEDYKKMIEWMKDAFLTPNEIRSSVKWESLDVDGMDTPWVQSGLKRVDDVGISTEEINKAYNLGEIL